MRIILSALMALLAANAWAGQPSPALVANVQRQLVDKSRYMSPPGACENADELFEDWPSGSVTKCTYSRSDTFTAAKTGRMKTRTFEAIVYVANADATRLATWIETACSRVVSEAYSAEACSKELIGVIRGQSGSQFPVAGQVFEDLSCDAATPSICEVTLERRVKGSLETKVERCAHDDIDGCIRRATRKGGWQAGARSNHVQEMYMFRNGVTVRVVGCTNGEDHDATIVDPYASCRDDDSRNRSLAASSARTGKARISSTTPAMFRAYTGDASIQLPTPNDADKSYFETTDKLRYWLDLVSSTYRRALSSDDNPLLDAYICSSHPTRACRPENNGYATWLSQQQ
uniref:hypothetical protein n=1 Tax=uncultured Rhizobium sp. TaxID=155567 RepID=UPI00261E16AA|nr:hypothetical protein [uncultured Rhizobium sp.]